MDFQEEFRRKSKKNNGRKGELDYSNVSNNLQQLIDASIIGYRNDIITKFNMKDAKLAVLMISLIMSSPIKTFDNIKEWYNKFKEVIDYASEFVSTTILKHKEDSYNYIEIKDKHINEGSDRAYTSFDWFIKNLPKKANDKSNTRILTMKNQIKAPLKDLECDHYDYILDVPSSDVNEFEYKEVIFKYKRESETVVICGKGEKGEDRNTTVNSIKIWALDDKEDILYRELPNYIFDKWATETIDTTWVQKCFRHTGSIATWVGKTMNHHRPANTVFLDDDLNLKIIEEIATFITPEKKKWHVERGIPYKRNYLFYGPPGTGKTSMIYAIANALKKDIAFLNLGQIKNDDKLMTLVSKQPPNSILVIEELDRVSDVVLKTKKRKSTPEPIKEETTDDGKKTKEVKKEGITLPCLFKLLDGTDTEPGKLIFMTANHPKRLNRTLVRDSRIDRKILFNNASISTVVKMFNWFYDTDKYTEEIVLPYIYTAKINKLKPAAILVILSNSESEENSLDALKECFTKSLFEKYDDEDSDADSDEDDDDY